MKNAIIYIYIVIISMVFQGCSLEEDQPFLVNETVYQDANNAAAALQGIYERMTEYDFFSSSYYNTLNRNSGFFVTNQAGQSNTNPFNSTICSLKPLDANANVRRVWEGHYGTISRANDAISGITFTDVADLEDEEFVLNDIAGQAHFIRAYCYFNLVRLYGDVPLRTETASAETLNVGKTDAKTIYDQVIKDAKIAAQYMNGAMGAGFPKQYAANMLLAKVYMQLATAPAELQDAGTDYWQLAYDEAIKVYGQYELVDDYGQLFDTPGENSVESIFEVQFSQIVSINYAKEFTAPHYAGIQSWGWWQLNVDVYDRHAAAYPSDPRIDETFLSDYIRTNNGVNVKTYPSKAVRDWWGGAFPYLFKTCQKDTTAVSWAENRNAIIYRYGDLLLMLAEISNELQNGEQLGYVTELLARPSVNLTPRALYSTGQAGFREAIMSEYTFELLGEGQDWFNNRRRGYAWFKQHTIDAHNNSANFDPQWDVTLSSNEDEVMFLPIPADEINRNDEISGDD